MLHAALDGWRARRATHLVLLALAVVATAGVWTAVWFARAADTSALATLPLLVLVVVAMSVCGAELTRERRRELAIMRLRGGRPVPVAVLVSAEPLLSLLGGALVGVGAGLAGTAAFREAWLPGGSDQPLLHPAPAVAVAVVVAVSLATVATSARRALNRPLAEQTAVHERRRPAGTWLLFAQVFVVVAAAVAIFQVVDRPGSGGWVVHAGPAVLGLAGGVLAIWLVRATGWLLGVLGRDRLPSSLAAARIRRTTDTSAPLAVLVAGGVVAVLAGGSWVAADHWVDDAGKIVAGAPLVMRFDGAAAGALAATERVDPDGRWVMAGVRALSDDRPESRRFFLDTARFERVVGDHLATTPAAEGARAVAALAAATRALPGQPVARGGDWVVRVSATGIDRPADLTLRAEYVGPAGAGVAEIELLVPPGQTRGGHVPLGGCAEGCRIRALSVTEGWPCTQEAERRRLCDRPVLRFGAAEAGGVDLVTQPWELQTAEEGGPAGRFRAEPGLLELQPDREGQARLVPRRDLVVVPVLATHDVAWDGDPLVRTAGGDERPAELVGRHAVLPIVSAGGVVGDLRRALEGSSPDAAAAEALVLARADTPAAVLEALRAEGAGPPETDAEVGARIGREAEALQTRIGLVVAGAGLLIGALAFAAPMGRTRRTRAREEAVLRLLHVPAGERRAAGRLELATTALGAAGVVLVTGFVGVAGLLAHLRLLEVPANQPPVESGAGADGVLLVLAGVTVAAWLAVLLTGLAGRHLPPAATVPAALREGAAR